MSSNVVRAGAAYEAILVDKITGSVKTIVKSLEILRQAFKEVNPEAKDLNRELNGVAAAMREAAREKRLPSRISQISSTFMKAASHIATASQSIGQAMIHIGNQIRMAGLMATGAAAAMTALFVSMVRKAGDATEAINAFNAVFQGSAKAVGKWADDFAAAIGRSRMATKQGLTNFRAFFTGLGFADREADALSTSMQALAVDFGSFFNLSDEEAMRRFLGGLAGQSENLLRFGINVQDAQLNMTDFAKSIGKTSAQMTQLEKARARIEIITKTMKDLNAEGDAFRTRFSLQNRIKAMSSAFDELRVSIGGALEGQAQSVVAGLTAVFQRLGQMAPAQLQKVIGLISTLAAAGVGLVVLGTALAALGPPILALGSVLATLLASLPILIKLLPMIPVAMVGLMGAYQGLLSMDLEGLLSRVSRSFERFGQLAKDAIEGISLALQADDWEGALERFKLSAIVMFKELARMLKYLLTNAWDEVTQAIGDTLGVSEGSRAERLQRISDRANNMRPIDDMLDATEEKERLLFLRAQDHLRKAQQHAEAIKEGVAELPEKLAMGMMHGLERFRGEAARWLGRAGREAEEEFGGENAPPGGYLDALRDYPIKAEVERIRRSFASVGGFSNQFAMDAGSFAPVMGPIEKNTEELVRLGNEAATRDEIMANNLQTIADNSELNFQ